MDLTPFELNTRKVLTNLSMRETPDNQDSGRCYKISIILQNYQDHLKSKFEEIVKTK